MCYKLQQVSYTLHSNIQTKQMKNGIRLMIALFESAPVYAYKRVR